VLLILAIFCGVMALVTGAYGMKDFSSVLGRIAQISFLVFLVVFVAAVLLQV
jgi:uncharacterized membrane protein YtjA (UPF0391 family)